MNRGRHIALQCLTAIVILVVIVGMAGVLVVQSGWFRERVRTRIISEIESATGGRVEISNFSFDWTHLSATISPFILHGKESDSEDPLARVDSISVGLRVISALERRVDLASLHIQKPSVHITVYPDGSTNLPTPHRPPGEKDWAQNIVDLAVRHYEVANGSLEIDQRHVPFNIRGDDLRLVMNYATGRYTPGKSASGPHYRGELSSGHVRVGHRAFGADDFDAGNFAPIDARLNATFLLDSTHAEFPQINITTGKSRVNLMGSFTNLRAPRGKFSVKAAMDPRDLMVYFPKGVTLAGSASFDGDLDIAFADKFDFTLAGRASARGVSYQQGRVSITDGTLSANARLTPALLTLREVNATAMGSNFTGQADLIDYKKLHLEGNFENAGVRTIVKMLTDRPVAWNGEASGVLMLDAIPGTPSTQLKVKANIMPLPNEGTPLQGQVDLRYDQHAGTISFGESQVSTPATSANLSGTLGQTLEVRAQTTNLEDVLPALAILMDNPPQSLPVRLTGGVASVAGTVTGPLDDPQFRGQASVIHASVKGHAFDRFTGEVQASQRAITVSRVTLVRGAAQISGDATIAAVSGDFTNGALAGHLVVSNIQLAEITKEFGGPANVSGLASANVDVAGNAQHPEADIRFDVTKLKAYDQTADHLHADVRYTAQSLNISNGEADITPGKVLFTGSFAHPENIWTTGDLRGEVTAQSVPAHVITALRKAQPDADAMLNGKTAFDARLDQGVPTLRSLNGNMAARGITFRTDTLGDLAVTASSTNNNIAVQINGKVHESNVSGQGQWRLDAGNAGNPGSATVHFSRISIATLHGLVMLGGVPGQISAPPPFDGFVEGGATVDINLRDPKNFKAEVKLDTLELTPKPSQVLRLDVKAQDIQLRNTGPLVISLSLNEARIRSAHFTARETSLEATGVLPFTGDGGADLNIKGNVNLAILQLLNPDLLARGTATVGTSIRGSLRNPALSGRMELMNASLYMADVPNGLDRANGVILFDRNRATIDHLTAETGGGQLALKGSLEFGDVLVYRLQAEAHQVRVRYPEDVSITADAQLALNGTSDASTLTGTLTLNRAAISPGADLGHLLATAAQPSPSPPNASEYLRGMRFDIHIESAPTFQMETSLTRNIQTEVDLRLRGTPLAPALLGTVSANSGEVQIFGNRYTINRGDIRFTNPIKMEPVLDLNLETRARGITVTVTVTGSPQKLNVNYSSDPPLQSREIIALLAVGRDPTALSTNSQITASTTSGFGDAGGLLGEAVSQQLSNRLQRFFGSSRVKIDPTVTGVDTLPSARLTLEQQVSRDVTLTYTTNLNRTQEQIVRLEWDLSQQWSAVAVRDANGLFGIDFQYRKRFK